jgi:membrane-associated phospholipid phosphatase
MPHRRRSHRNPTGMTDRHDLAWRMFNLNWIAVAAMGIVLFAAVSLSDFSIGSRTLAIICAIVASLTLIVYIHRLVKSDQADPKLVFSLGTIAQVVLITAIAGPLSYVAGSLDWPLQDHTLLVMDRAIGMDPKVIATFVNDHPWLAKALASAYGLIKWPLLGVPIILAMTLRLVRLQQFIAALCIALVVTITISAFVPAIGTYYGLGLSSSDFPSLITVYDAQLRDLQALRAGSLRHLEMFHLSGIVSFPSFHAASAVLYIWAVWPVRCLGWIFLVLNMLMIASTPAIGAHYMVDVIAGIVVACGSIVAAGWLSESADRRAPSSALARAVGFSG